MNNHSPGKCLVSFSSPFFDIGQIEITSTAKQLLAEEEIIAALTRHGHCDFGEVSWEHRTGNLEMIEQSRGSVTSVYATSTGRKFCVITRLDEFEPHTSIATLQQPDNF